MRADARGGLVRLACAAVMALVVGEPLAAQPFEPPADAYADAVARELLERARARRLTTDRRIERYETTATERMSVGLNAGIVEKLLYRRETVSRIDWRRDGPVAIEVLAAREVVPPASGTPQVPVDLAGYMPRLAFDPVDSEMLLRFDTTVIRHPLAAGSEAHYRFGAGDSTVVRLPDGRTVRLRELRIQPRRRDRQLISGSFWIDVETYAVVQAYFRLADVVRGRRGVSPRLGAPSAELDYIAIDYGLWDLRWWLPRTVAARGVMQAAGLRLPLNYERRYTDYRVTGDTAAVVPVAAGGAPEPRPCRPRMSMAISVGGGSARDDTVRARLARGDSAGRRRAAARPDSAGVACDREFVVTADPDRDLLTSELLPPDIYGADAALLTDEELRGIAERLRDLPEPPWRLATPTLALATRAPGLLRYNRVEGLSIGARAGLDLARLEGDAELRFGTADRTFSGAVGLSRTGRVVQSRLAGYHRLDAFDIATQPFTALSTIGALVFGSDDNDYFRASGAELTFAPPPSGSQWYDVRLFAERQREVSKNTDWSLPHALSSSHVFRDNAPADDAVQFGARLRLRTAHGTDPRAFRWAGELTLHGEAGDYLFARPSAVLRAGMPLTSRLTAAVEAAGGTAMGDAPLQRAWLIGGSTTIRGYDAATLAGDTYWRARAELGVGVTFTRLALFGDAGWAGPREDAGSGRPIRALGTGLSIMDGLFRADVARGLDRSGSWRVHFQFNGVL